MGRTLASLAERPSPFSYLFYEVRDLIQFDPIESVVELRSADERDRAEGLVRNYVISDSMADRLADVVFPQLQFERPADNKGLMVVGNYGTGKSHLMAVHLRSRRVRRVATASRRAVAEARPEVAGRFKVIRTELGSTQDAISASSSCRQLEAALARVGRRLPVSRLRPGWQPQAGVRGDDGCLQRRASPTTASSSSSTSSSTTSGRGRGSSSRSISTSSVRSARCAARAGSGSSPGLQEMLFDNPSFQFAASAVQRVKDRFEQVLIAKQRRQVRRRRAAPPEDARAAGDGSATTSSRSPRSTGG